MSSYESMGIHNVLTKIYYCINEDSEKLLQCEQSTPIHSEIPSTTQSSTNITSSAPPFRVPTTTHEWESLCIDYLEEYIAAHQFPLDYQRPSSIFEGQTILMYAARYKKTRIIKWLIAHNADPTLHHSLLAGYNVLTYVLAPFDLNYDDNTIEMLNFFLIKGTPILSSAYAMFFLMTREIELTESYMEIWALLYTTDKYAIDIRAISILFSRKVNFQAKILDQVRFELQILPWEKMNNLKENIVDPNSDKNIEPNSTRTNNQPVLTQSSLIKQYTYSIDTNIVNNTNNDLIKPNIPTNDPHIGFYKIFNDIFSSTLLSSSPQIRDQALTIAITACILADNINIGLLKHLISLSTTKLISDLFILHNHPLFKHNPFPIGWHNYPQIQSIYYEAAEPLECSILHSSVESLVKTAAKSKEIDVFSAILTRHAKQLDYSVLEAIDLFIKARIPLPDVSKLIKLLYTASLHPGMGGEILSDIMQGVLTFENLLNSGNCFENYQNNDKNGKKIVYKNDTANNSLNEYGLINHPKIPFNITHSNNIIMEYSYYNYDERYNIELFNEMKSRSKQLYPNKIVRNEIKKKALFDVISTSLLSDILIKLFLLFLSHEPTNASNLIALFLTTCPSLPIQVSLYFTMNSIRKLLDQVNLDPDFTQNDQSGENGENGEKNAIFIHDNDSSRLLTPFEQFLTGRPNSQLDVERTDFDLNYDENISQSDEKDDFKNDNVDESDENSDEDQPISILTPVPLNKSSSSSSSLTLSSSLVKQIDQQGNQSSLGKSGSTSSSTSSSTMRHSTASNTTSQPQTTSPDNKINPNNYKIKALRLNRAKVSPPIAKMKHNIGKNNANNANNNNNNTQNSNNNNSQQNFFQSLLEIILPFFYSNKETPFDFLLISEFIFSVLHVNLLSKKSLHTRLDRLRSEKYTKLFFPTVYHQYYSIHLLRTLQSFSTPLDCQKLSFLSLLDPLLQKSLTKPTLFGPLNYTLWTSPLTTKQVIGLYDFTANINDVLPVYHGEIENQFKKLIFSIKSPHFYQYQIIKGISKYCLPELSSRAPGIKVYPIIPETYPSMYATRLWALVRYWERNAYICFEKIYPHLIGEKCERNNVLKSTQECDRLVYNGVELIVEPVLDELYDRNQEMYWYNIKNLFENSLAKNSSNNPNSNLVEKINSSSLHFISPSNSAFSPPSPDPTRINIPNNNLDIYFTPTISFGDDFFGSKLFNFYSNRTIFPVHLPWNILEILTKNPFFVLDPFSIYVSHFLHGVTVKSIQYLSTVMVNLVKYDHNHGKYDRIAHSIELPPEKDHDDKKKLSQFDENDKNQRNLAIFQESILSEENISTNFPLNFSSLLSTQQTGNANFLHWTGGYNIDGMTPQLYKKGTKLGFFGPQQFGDQSGEKKRTENHQNIQFIDMINTTIGLAVPIAEYINHVASVLGLDWRWDDFKINPLSEKPSIFSDKIICTNPNNFFLPKKNIQNAQNRPIFSNPKNLSNFVSTKSLFYLFHNVFKIPGQLSHSNYLSPSNTTVEHEAFFNRIHKSLVKLNPAQFTLQKLDDNKNDSNNISPSIIPPLSFSPLQKSPQTIPNTNFSSDSLDSLVDEFILYGQTAWFGLPGLVVPLATILRNFSKIKNLLPFSPDALKLLPDVSTTTTTTTTETETKTQTKTQTTKTSHTNSSNPLQPHQVLEHSTILTAPSLFTIHDCLPTHYKQFFHFHGHSSLLPIYLSPSLTRAPDIHSLYSHGNTPLNYIVWNSGDSCIKHVENKDTLYPTLSQSKAIQNSLIVDKNGPHFRHDTPLIFTPLQRSFIGTLWATHTSYHYYRSESFDYHIMSLLYTLSIVWRTTILSQSNQSTLEILSIGVMNNKLSSHHYTNLNFLPQFVWNQLFIILLIGLRPSNLHTRLHIIMYAIYLYKLQYAIMLPVMNQIQKHDSRFVSFVLTEQPILDIFPLLYYAMCVPFSSQLFQPPVLFKHPLILPGYWCHSPQTATQLNFYAFFVLDIIKKFPLFSSFFHLVLLNTPRHFTNYYNFTSLPTISHGYNINNYLFSASNPIDQAKDHFLTLSFVYSIFLTPQGGIELSPVAQSNRKKAILLGKHIQEALRGTENYCCVYNGKHLEYILFYLFLATYLPGETSSYMGLSTYVYAIEQKNMLRRNYFERVWDGYLHKDGKKGEGKFARNGFEYFEKIISQNDDNLNNFTQSLHNTQNVNLYSIPEPHRSSSSTRLDYKLYLPTQTDYSEWNNRQTIIPTDKKSLFLDKKTSLHDNYFFGAEVDTTLTPADYKSTYTDSYRSFLTDTVNLDMFDEDGGLIQQGAEDTNRTGNNGIGGKQIGRPIGEKKFVSPLDHFLSAPQLPMGSIVTPTICDIEIDTFDQNGSVSLVQNDLENSQNKLLFKNITQNEKMFAKNSCQFLYRNYPSSLHTPMVHIQDIMYNGNFESLFSWASVSHFNDIERQIETLFKAEKEKTEQKIKQHNENELQSTEEGSTKNDPTSDSKTNISPHGDQKAPIFGPMTFKKQISRLRVQSNAPHESQYLQILFLTNPNCLQFEDYHYQRAQPHKPSTISILKNAVKNIEQQQKCDKMLKLERDHATLESNNNNNNNKTNKTNNTSGDSEKKSTGGSKTGGSFSNTTAVTANILTKYSSITPKAKAKFPTITTNTYQSKDVIDPYDPISETFDLSKFSLTTFFLSSIAQISAYPTTIHNNLASSASSLRILTTSSWSSDLVQFLTHSFQTRLLPLRHHTANFPCLPLSPTAAVTFESETNSETLVPVQHCFLQGSIISHTIIRYAHKCVQQRLMPPYINQNTISPRKTNPIAFLNEITPTMLFGEHSTPVSILAKSLTPFQQRSFTPEYIFDLANIIRSEILKLNRSFPTPQMYRANHVAIRWRDTLDVAIRLLMLKHVVVSETEVLVIQFLLKYLTYMESSTHYIISLFTHLRNQPHTSLFYQLFELFLKQPGPNTLEVFQSRSIFDWLLHASYHPSLRTNIHPIPPILTQEQMDLVEIPSAATVQNQTQNNTAQKLKLQKFSTNSYYLADSPYSYVVDYIPQLTSEEQQVQYTKLLSITSLVPVYRFINEIDFRLIIRLLSIGMQPCSSLRINSIFIEQCSLFFNTDHYFAPNTNILSSDDDDDDDNDDNDNETDYNSNSDASTDDSDSDEDYKPRFVFTKKKRQKRYNDNDDEKISEKTSKKIDPLSNINTTKIVYIDNVQNEISHYYRDSRVKSQTYPQLYTHNSSFSQFLKIFSFYTTIYYPPPMCWRLTTYDFDPENVDPTFSTPDTNPTHHMGYILKYSPPPTAFGSQGYGINSLNNTVHINQAFPICTHYWSVVHALLHHPSEQLKIHIFGKSYKNVIKTLSPEVLNLLFRSDLTTFCQKYRFALFFDPDKLELLEIEQRHNTIGGLHLDENTEVHVVDEGNTKSIRSGIDNNPTNSANNAQNNQQKDFHPCIDLGFFDDQIYLSYYDLKYGQGVSMQEQNTGTDSTRSGNTGPASAFENVKKRHFDEKKRISKLIHNNNSDHDDDDDDDDNDDDDDTNNNDNSDQDDDNDANNNDDNANNKSQKGQTKSTKKGLCQPLPDDPLNGASLRKISLLWYLLNTVMLSVDDFSALMLGIENPSYMQGDELISHYSDDDDDDDDNNNNNNDNNDNDNVSDKNDQNNQHNGVENDSTGGNLDNFENNLKKEKPKPIRNNSLLLTGLNFNIVNDYNQNILMFAILRHSSEHILTFLLNFFTLDSFFQHYDVFGRNSYYYIVNSGVFNHTPQLWSYIQDNVKDYTNFPPIFNKPESWGENIDINPDNDNQQARFAGEHAPQWNTNGEKNYKF